MIVFMSAIIDKGIVIDHYYLNDPSSLSITYLRICDKFIMNLLRIRHKFI